MIFLLLVLCVTRPLLEPERYPIVEHVVRDRITTDRYGPIIVVRGFTAGSRGLPFVMYGEIRRDGSVLLHWWFEGEYSHSETIKRVPKF